MPFAQWLARLRGLIDARTDRPGGSAPHSADVVGSEYRRWVEQYDRLSDAEADRIRNLSNELASRPPISVVMALGATREPFLAEAIASIRAQANPHWELSIAHDERTDPDTRAMLDELCRTEARVKLAATPAGSGLGERIRAGFALTSGEAVCIMSPRDRLRPHTLYMLAAELAKTPEPDLVYSDEDTIDSEGRRQTPYFKGEWNLDLFYSTDFAGRFAAVKSVSIREAGGFCDADGAEVYDVLLRMLERKPDLTVRHIPHILYHRRAEPTAGRDDGAAGACRSLHSHFIRLGKGDIAVSPVSPAHRRVVWPVPSPAPLVSLVIPTRDRVELLRECVDGLLNRTYYKNIEVIIVDNNSSEAESFQYFADLKDEKRVRVLNFPGEFNFSAINNFGVSAAKGQIIGLINNDIETIEPGWLDEMVGHAVRPDIGAVGALLYYGDDTVQHAGVVLGIGGVGSHIHKRLPAGEPGYFWRARLAQDVSAVTAACLVMRRDVFEKVGGLDAENFRVAYNDVDLCLRITDAGYRIVWTPFARLYHLESASRGDDKTAERRARLEREKAAMMRKWGNRLSNDPYFSANLSLCHIDCRIAFPPRVIPPWREPLAVAPTPQTRY